MDTLPIPVFRCPWRLKDDNLKKQFYTWHNFRELSGFGGIAVPKEVAILNWRLGTIKMLVYITFFGLLWWYQIYVAKGYLATASVDAMSRLQVQHPVLQYCNPLKKNCSTNFKDMRTLCYCKQSTNESCLSLTQPPEKFTCEYLDEFDLDQSNVENNFLLPTRRTLILQDLTCDAPEGGDCQRRYTVTESEIFYMADIESFTVLMDHSFVCQELGTFKNAWEMMGFYSPCITVGGVGSKDTHWRPLKGPSTDYLRAPKCARLPIPIADHFKEDWNKIVTERQQARLKQIWQVGDQPVNQTQWIYAIPNGVILNVGDMLKELKLDLDESVDDTGNDGAPHTKRYDGFVLRLEITYHNFHTYTLPTMVLPPIYTVNFMLLPTQEYKTMSSRTPYLHSLSFNNRSRIVDVRHGIHFSVSPTGVLGEPSFINVFWILLESLVLKGIVNWFMQLFLLNWFSGEKGDTLEETYLTEVIELHQKEEDEEGPRAFNQDDQGGAQLLDVEGCTYWCNPADKDLEFRRRGYALASSHEPGRKSVRGSKVLPAGSQAGGPL